jgi:ABC-2 type transport system ATP-binding protein
MTEALRLEDVWKRYATHIAVRELSLSVPAGTIYGILGPNGAGKSTTLRMVMNIIASDAGTIRVLGAEPKSRDVLRRVGYLPEERGLYRRMSVIDVIVFFGRLKGMTRVAARRAAGDWLERMGLGDWRSARVDSLSKGMQQKVQFITTVLHGPELLILDEPQSGLDPVNQEVLRETILKTRADGGSVVLSTHNMDQAETLCDAVCIIAGGRKVLDGGIAEVRRRYRGDRYRLVLDPDRITAEDIACVDRVLSASTTNCEREESVVSWTMELNGGLSHELLQRIATLEVPVDRFERISPTLHEIFIEQVGAAARTPRREVADA